MSSLLTADLYWLTLTLVMTGLLWIPIIINRIQETGAWATLASPQLIPSAPWAENMRRAHANAIENLMIFAPLVLAIQVTHTDTSTTATACSVYFFARLIHVISYVAAIPIVRTIAFAIGFICQIICAITLLQATQ